MTSRPGGNSVEQKIDLIIKLAQVDDKVTQGYIKSHQIPSAFFEILLAHTLIDAPRRTDIEENMIQAGSMVEGASSCRLLKGEKERELDALIISVPNINTETEFSVRTSPVPGRPGYFTLPGFNDRIEEFNNSVFPDNCTFDDYAAPAFTQHSISSGVSCDLVFAVQLNFFPSEARGWKNRPRTWPSITDVVAICQMPCHAVHKPTAPGREHQDEMYMSFTLGEQRLAHLRTSDMKVTYFCFKAIFYNTFNFKYYDESSENDKEFGSYLTKTVFNWMCEELPPKSWSLNNLHDNLCKLFTRLTDSIDHRILLHYWIPELNILQHHPAGLYEMYESKVDTDGLRTDPLSLLPDNIQYILSGMKRKLSFQQTNNLLQDQLFTSLGCTPPPSHVVRSYIVYMDADNAYTTQSWHCVEAYHGLLGLHTTLAILDHQLFQQSTSKIVAETWMSGMVNHPNLVAQIYFRWLSHLAAGLNLYSSCLAAATTTTTKFILLLSRKPQEIGRKFFSSLNFVVRFHSFIGTQVRSFTQDDPIPQLYMDSPQGHTAILMDTLVSSPQAAQIYFTDLSHLATGLKLYSRWVADTP